MPNIDHVWGRFRLHEGQTFVQKTGKTFTYTVRGNVLRPNTTNRNLPKSQFANALEKVPVGGPGSFVGLQGPSYLYAILMDHRIRGTDW
jgi:hypothetical protein